MVSIKQILEETLGLPEGSLKIKSQEVTIVREINLDNYAFSVSLHKEKKQ